MVLRSAITLAERYGRKHQQTGEEMAFERQSIHCLSATMISQRSAID